MTKTTYKPGQMYRLPIEAIYVPPKENRQRQEDVDVSDLMLSIAEVGQLQNIGINTTGTLQWGWRRITAMKELGYTEIDATCVNAKGPQRAVLEFVENYCRKNLPWYETALALWNIHSEYKNFQDGWRDQDTIELLGISQSTFSDNQLAAGYALANPEQCKKIPMREALARMRSKARSNKEELLKEIEDDVLDGFEDGIEGTLGEEATPTPSGEQASPTTDQHVGGELPPADASKPSAKPKPKPRQKPYNLVNGSCYDYELPEGEKPFTFLHLDPPYGINVAARESLKSNRSGVEGSYEDTPELFEQAIQYWLRPNSLINQKFCSAIIWHAPQATSFVKDVAFAYEWDVMPFPAIWHKSDNKGVIPVITRDLRRNYEIATLMYKGADIVQNLAACVSGPSTNTGLHKTEKPIPILQHFIRAMLPNRARVLDPFGGSFNFISALAQHKDHLEFAVGIEQDEDFFTRASEAVNITWGMERASQAISSSVGVPKAEPVQEPAPLDDLDIDL